MCRLTSCSFAFSSHSSCSQAIIYLASDKWIFVANCKLVPGCWLLVAKAPFMVLARSKFVFSISIGIRFKALALLCVPRIVVVSGARALQHNHICTCSRPNPLVSGQSLIVWKTAITSFKLKLISRTQSHTNNNFAKSRRNNQSH